MTDPEREKVAAAASRPDGGAGSDPLARAFLALALVLALVRFVRLGRWSLWFDEAATYTDWYVGLEGGEISNPLGYHLIAWGRSLFGAVPDEAALRWVPAAFGVLAVPLVAFGARRMFGARAAALAALAVAVSSWHVSWSQTARFYTMALDVSFAGAAAYLAGLAGGRALVALFGLVLAAAAGAFHPSAMLVLPALVIAPWLAGAGGDARFVRARKLATAAAVLVAVAVAAWSSETLANYLRQKGGAGGGLGPAVDRVEHLALTTGFYLTPLVATAALCGAVWAGRARSRPGRMAGVLVAGTLATAAALALYGARMTAQYVFVLLPWVALLAAAPVADARFGRWPAVAYAALLVLPQLANLGLYFTVRQGERPAWREAYQYVWNQRGPDDLVLGMEATAGEFYVAPLETDLRQTKHVQWLDRWRAALPEQWAPHARRTWYVLNPEQLLDWEPQDAEAMRRFLEEECRLVRSWPLYVESRNLSVYVYVR